MTPAEFLAELLRVPGPGWDRATLYGVAFGGPFTPAMTQRAYEGFCPICEAKLVVTTEAPGSRFYEQSIEDAIGEEYDSVMLDCTCCGAIVAFRRGEPLVERLEWAEDWRGEPDAAPCEHVAALRAATATNA